MMEDTLQYCALFKGMDLSQIRDLLAQYPHQLKRFNAKSFAALQHDVCDRLMILTSGQVQAQMIDSFGKLIIVEDLNPYQVLAPAFLFPDENRMPVSLLVLDDAEILYFRKPVFMEMMQAYQPVLLNFLRMISNRSKFLSDRMKFHAFKSLRGKIAQYLLEQLAIQGSSQIKIGHTQQELADRFGVTRPSLARSFAEMEKTGLITMKNKNVEIIDLNGLKQLE